MTERPKLRKPFLQKMDIRPDGAPVWATAHLIWLGVETDTKFEFIREYEFWDEAKEGLRLLTGLLVRFNGDIALCKEIVESYVHIQGEQATKSDPLPNHYRPPKRRKAYL